MNVGAFTTKGHYHAAQRVSEDAAGWDYELLVPSVADLTVSVIAFNAQALDAAGKGVTGATPESFKTTPAELSKVRSFQLVPLGK